MQISADGRFWAPELPRALIPETLVPGGTAVVPLWLRSERDSLARLELSDPSASPLWRALIVEVTDPATGSTVKPGNDGSPLRTPPFALAAGRPIRVEVHLTLPAGSSVETQRLVAHPLLVAAVSGRPDGAKELASTGSRPADQVARTLGAAAGVALGAGLLSMCRDRRSRPRRRPAC